VFIESPYRKVEERARGGLRHRRQFPVTASYKVGDYAEKSRDGEVNADLKERRKSRSMFEPFSFLSLGLGRKTGTLSLRPTLSWTIRAVSPASWSTPARRATSCW